MLDILACTQTDDDFGGALRYAAQLAVASAAGLTAIQVCGAPLAVAPAIRPEIVAAFEQQARDEFRHAIRRREGFEGWATTLGVARAEWLVAMGDPVNIVVEVAQRHDLVVMAHAEGRADVRGELAGIVLKSAAPCLILPHGVEEYRPFTRVAIGWNGSPEAMRALRFALPWLRGCEVVLLCGEERAYNLDAEWDPAFNVVDYLATRGVHATTSAVTGASDAAGIELLVQARSQRADLLVMGAYGRTRFSEWLLGGATRDVLAHADMPVLMRH